MMPRFPAAFSAAIDVVAATVVSGVAVLSPLRTLSTACDILSAGQVISISQAPLLSLMCTSSLRSVMSTLVHLSSLSC